MARIFFFFFFASGAGGLVSFTQPNYFEILPCCHVYQRFTHCTDIPSFAYSAVDGHLGSFQVLDIINKAAIDIRQGESP